MNDTSSLPCSVAMTKPWIEVLSKQEEAELFLHKLAEKLALYVADLLGPHEFVMPDRMQNIEQEGVDDVLKGLSDGWLVKAGMPASAVEIVTPALISVVFRAEFGKQLQRHVPNALPVELQG